MKIFLRKQSAFTFRGVPHYELDLLGETAYSLMKTRLCAEEFPGECKEDHILLDPVYPFLTRDALFSFADGREGSYRFRGGEVVRAGCAMSNGIRQQTAALGQPFFSLGDFPAVLALAARESAALHTARGALVECGAEVSYLSEIGPGAIVERGAKVLGRSTIGENAEIGSGSNICDSAVGRETRVSASVLIGAKVGERCSVGPFAYLREGTTVGNECRIGDFVEIKNAAIGNKSKVAHLAYVGDAAVGEKVNVGCGVVFANYDGKKKSRIEVGDDCFIGSNCNLIAPLAIGDGAFIAAGSTVTLDLAAEDFCVARCRETVKPHRGKRYYDP